MDRGLTTTTGVQAVREAHEALALARAAGDSKAEARRAGGVESRWISTGKSANLIAMASNLSEKWRAGGSALSANIGRGLDFSVVADVLWVCRIVDSIDAGAAWSGGVKRC